MGFSFEAISSALVTAFTCVTVVWIASGVYLSQKHLEEYSKELKQHRIELAEHTKAFSEVSASLQASTFIQVFSQAESELGIIERKLMKDIFSIPNTELNLSRLHGVNRAHETLLETFSKHTHSDKKLLAENYCKLFEMCEGLVKNHPDRETIRTLFLSRSNHAKNYTLLKAVLTRLKRT